MLISKFFGGVDFLRLVDKYIVSDKLGSGPCEPSSVRLLQDGGLKVKIRKEYNSGFACLFQDVGYGVWRQALEVTTYSKNMSMCQHSGHVRRARVPISATLELSADSQDMIHLQHSAFMCRAGKSAA